MVWGTVAGMAGASLIGGLMGGSAAKKAAAAQQRAAAAALAEYANLGVPPELAKEIILQQYQQQGILTPELEQEIELQSSQVAQIKEDPALRNQQMSALDLISQAARGGLSAADRAGYNELRSSTQRDSEAKRQQILQQMGARGMSGSGAELMTQLQSAQGSDDQASAAADRLAAQASINALNSIAQQSQQAGSLRTQDLDVNKMRANAEDQRNQFLYTNSAARQSTNVAARNAAQAANLQQKQNIANQNVGQANAELNRQREAQQTEWQNKMNLASAKANANLGIGAAQQAAGQQQANMYQGIGNALAQGIGTYGANKIYQDSKTKKTPWSAED